MESIEELLPKEMNENRSNFQVESQKQIISIKEAKATDVPAIYKLSLCFSGATKGWTQSEIEEIIENRQCYYVLTSERNGEIIGYALARFAWGKLHLMDIVVKEEMRLRGVGKKMMKQLIDFAKSKELSEVYLEVRASNIPAVKLYQSLSFKNRFIFRGLYDGEDGIAMYLPLEEEKERTLV
ncbi:ribosomal protein S18-alanine N-acetyltransferase [bacterium]|nr:ribosomal protein S18-alanine N-acetyltransferase [bacterium]